MSGKQPRSSAFVISTMTVCLLLLVVPSLQATPIKPDVREVLARPVQPVNTFAPARAGWDGPETPKTVSFPGATYDQLGPSGTAREVHQALFAAFVPDFRALAGITLVIMLLRRIVVTRRRLLATATASANGVTPMDRAAAQAEPISPRRAA